MSPLTDACTQPRTVPSLTYWPRVGRHEQVPAEADLRHAAILTPDATAGAEAHIACRDGLRHGHGVGCIRARVAVAAHDRQRNIDVDHQTVEERRAEIGMQQRLMGHDRRDHRAG
jgi:hypothetical protein